MSGIRAEASHDFSENKTWAGQWQGLGGPGGAKNKGQPEKATAG